jgi:polyferredoxin
MRSANAKVGRVWSDECTTCMRCVDECPVRDTLMVRTRQWPRAMSAPMIAALVVGVFATVTAFAMASGHWNNSLSPAEYLQRFEQIAAGALAR